MTNLFKTGWVCLVVLTAACGPSIPDGNASLGISAFQIEETKDLTTVIGVDAQQREVGRLELIHGQFMPTEDSGEAVNAMVDGRKLKVSIAGQEMAWETAGYTDTTQMPKLPKELSIVASFVDDRHVKPLLQKWYIGWLGKPAIAPIGEIAYDIADSEPDACDASREGTNSIACNSWGAPSCNCSIRSGAAPGRTTTMACNGLPEWMATSVDNFTPGDVFDGSTMFFCCGSNGITGNYAVKTCAANAGVSVGSGAGGPGAPSCPAGNFCSQCGVPTVKGNKCQPCFTPINYTSGCELTTQPDSGKTEVCHDYNGGACSGPGADCSSSSCCPGSSCQGTQHQTQCPASRGDPCSSSDDCCGGICMLSDFGGTCNTVGNGPPYYTYACSGGASCAAAVCIDENQTGCNATMRCCNTNDTCTSGTCVPPPPPPVCVDDNNYGCNTGGCCDFSAACTNNQCVVPPSCIDDGNSGCSDTNGPPCCDSSYQCMNGTCMFQE